MFDYLKRLKKQTKDGELGLVASSLAYSTVLSFIPFLAVSLAILQKLGGLESYYPKVSKWILSNFSETAGQEGIRLIHSAINRMLSGKLGFIGATILVLTSTRMISDMDTGINRVWNVRNRRSLIQRMFFYWLLILTFPFGLAGYVAINSTREFNNLNQKIGAELLQWIVLSSVLFFVYKVVPALKVRMSSALMGALIGSLLTIAVHKVFLWATHKVFNYGKLYGSIAAVPLVLLWVLLIWYGILVGAIVSASFKRIK